MYSQHVPVEFVFTGSKPLFEPAEPSRFDKFHSLVRLRREKTLVQNGKRVTKSVALREKHIHPTQHTPANLTVYDTDGNLYTIREYVNYETGESENEVLGVVHGNNAAVVLDQDAEERTFYLTDLFMDYWYINCVPGWQGYWNQLLASTTEAHRASFELSILLGQREHLYKETFTEMKTWFENDDDLTSLITSSDKYINNCSLYVVQEICNWLRDQPLMAYFNLYVQPIDPDDEYAYWAETGCTPVGNEDKISSVTVTKPFRFVYVAPQCLLYEDLEAAKLKQAADLKQAAEHFEEYQRQVEASEKINAEYKARKAHYPMSPKGKKQAQLSVMWYAIEKWLNQNHVTTLDEAAFKAFIDDNTYIFEDMNYLTSLFTFQHYKNMFVTENGTTQASALQLSDDDIFELKGKAHTTKDIERLVARRISELPALPVGDDIPWLKVPCPECPSHFQYMHRKTRTTVDLPLMAKTANSTDIRNTPVAVGGFEEDQPMKSVVVRAGWQSVGRFEWSYLQTKDDPQLEKDPEGRNLRYRFRNFNDMKLQLHEVDVATGDTKMKKLGFMIAEEENASYRGEKQVNALYKIGKVMVAGELAILGTGLTNGGGFSMLPPPLPTTLDHDFVKVETMLALGAFFTSNRAFSEPRDEADIRGKASKWYHDTYIDDDFWAPPLRQLFDGMKNMRATLVYPGDPAHSCYGVVVDIRTVNVGNPSEASEDASEDASEQSKDNICVMYWEKQKWDETIDASLVKVTRWFDVDKVLFVEQIYTDFERSQTYADIQEVKRQAAVSKLEKAFITDENKQRDYEEQKRAEDPAFLLRPGVEYVPKEGVFVPGDFTALQASRFIEKQEGELLYDFILLPHREGTEPRTLTLYASRVVEVSEDNSLIKTLKKNSMEDLASKLDTIDIDVEDLKHYDNGTESNEDMGLNLSEEDIEFLDRLIEKLKK